jgi:hypothetical protein
MIGVLPAMRSGDPPHSISQDKYPQKFGGSVGAQEECEKWELRQEGCAVGESQEALRCSIRSNPVDLKDGTAQSLYVI